MLPSQLFITTHAAQQPGDAPNRQSQQATQRIDPVGRKELLLRLLQALAKICRHGTLGIDLPAPGVRVRLQLVQPGHGLLQVFRRSAQSLPQCRSLGTLGLIDRR